MHRHGGVATAKSHHAMHRHANLDRRDELVVALAALAGPPKTTVVQSGGAALAAVAWYAKVVVQSVPPLALQVQVKLAVAIQAMKPHVR